MNITYTKPTHMFRIGDVKNLDPITVILHDHDPGRGSLIVTCFGRAWTCYWGGMWDGKTLAQFIDCVDAEYIANCLVRGQRSVITNRQIQDRELAYVTRIAAAVKSAVANGAAT